MKDMSEHNAKATRLIEEGPKGTIRELRITNEALTKRVAELEICNSEARALLYRLVKYIAEDNAVTPGVTRLARCADHVRDYLTRTHDPSGILRSEGPNA